MGKGGGGGNITGYRYYLAMLMGLCRGPLDSIVMIKADDIQIWPTPPLVTAPAPFPTAPTGTTPALPLPQLTVGDETGNTTFLIDADNAFGGDDKEGGVRGYIDLQMGAPDQDLTGSKFQSLVQTAQDLRGAATMFFRGADAEVGGHITTNSPYPKKWSVRVRRALQGWYGGTAWYPEEAVVVLDDGQGNAILAMNPAHIIYECLTNPVWGRGLKPTQLDESSFISAANTLCREKFGLCIAWTRQDDLSNFMQNIFNHMGAALYPDRTTGLLTMRLLRKDYVVSDLPVFDYTSGLLSVDDAETTAPDNSHSEIIVNWIDPVANNQRQTRMQNLAGTQANQTVTSTSVDYLGIPTASLAARVGQRDLALQGAGIKRFTLMLDRRGRKISPASVFCINVPDRNISNMVLRCGTVEEGAIGSQTIKVVALADVFALEDTTYAAEPERVWIPPDRTAYIVTDFKISEINYRDTVRAMTAAELATVPVDSGDPVVVAAAPTAMSLQYELETAGTGEAYADHGAFGWTPYATLVSPLGYYDTTMTVSGEYGMSGMVFPATAWIDDEIVEIISYNATAHTMVIGRGCIDTIPEPHLALARIWFPDFGQGADQREYTASEVVRLKLLTRTNTNVLADAPEQTFTVVGRQGKPYVPGDFRIGGNPFAAVTLQTGPVVFTWADRDRITQADHILVHQDPSTGPETGVTYQTDIYKGATLLRHTTGIATNTWTYDLTMAGADGSPGHVTVKLRAARGGILSFQEYSWSFYRVATGWGRGYGLRYG